MKEETVDVIFELLDNAKQLKEEKYIDAFRDVLKMMEELAESKCIIGVIGEELCKEFGEKWFAEFHRRVEKRLFEEALEDMDDDAFKQFLTDNMDLVLSIF